MKATKISPARRLCAQPEEPQLARVDPRAREDVHRAGRDADGDGCSTLQVALRHFTAPRLQPIQDRRPALGRTVGTSKALRRTIRAARASRPETVFALEVDGRAVGGIGLHPQGDVHRRAMEIGYWLGEPYWGRGIVTEAVRALTRYAFETFDIARVYAYVYEWNPASARVLEKAGYRLEGRLRKAVTKEGTTMDMLVYGFTEEDLAREGG